MFSWVFNLLDEYLQALFLFFCHMTVWWQKGLSWQLPYETRLNVSSHTQAILKSDQVSNSNFTNEEY